MGLLIKKRVNLDFLGDEYKESYIEFKAIPVKDFEAIQTEQKKIEDDDIKAIRFILDNLKKYFLSGKAPDDKGEVADLVADDMGDLDQQSVVKCFEILTGLSVNEEQDFLDKDSKTPSSITEDPPSNS